AAESALTDGNRVTARHLAAAAGIALARATTEARSEAPGTYHPRPSDVLRRRVPQVDADWRRRIEESLRLHTGNVAATARALGLHRTQLRRLIDRHGIIVDAFASGGNSEVDD